MQEEIRKPTVHSMKRRSGVHDYSRCGYYHITISVAPTLQQPFGRMAGRLDSPDGSDDSPHVELSAIGRMVERNRMMEKKTSRNLILHEITARHY